MNTRSTVLPWRGITRIDIAHREMPVVLGQQLAIPDADVALLVKALDRIDIAVIKARAFACLPPLPHRSG